MSLVSRAWHAVRHDFGRKLTALFLALGVWFVLEKIVLTDLPDSQSKLQIVQVASVEEADQERAQSVQSTVYLIVPANLIFKSCIPSTLSLKVKGLKQDVEGLVLSAYVQFSEADLEGEDQKTIPRTLSRDSFKSRGEPPELTYFRIGRESSADIQVTLVREDTLAMSLGAANVAITGKPANGFTVDASRASVAPNVVDVSGPSATIARFRTDPGALKLAAVSVDGRTGPVVQIVAPADGPDNRNVTLGTRDGKVTVTVPVEAEPEARELRAIRLNLLNEDVALKARHFRMVERPPDTLDLLVRGPKSELERLTNEQLAQRIYPIFDFSTADLLPGTNRPHVMVYPKDLSDAVKVYGLDKRNEAPLIQFKLESVPEGP